MRAALLAAALAGAAGCGGPPPQALSFGLAASPVTLDPRFATDAASSRVGRLLYDRLVDFDESFRPVPALATWVLESPTRYRFTLRPERARFSDGTRLTAEDVRAAYAAVLDPATASPHRGSLSNVKEIETLDAGALRFTLRSPDPLFPGRLVLGIPPARALAGGRDLGRRPLGSGPFALEGWTAGRLTLRRRTDGLRVAFVRVSDPTVRAMKLLSGELDMVQGDLPPELVSWLDGRPEVKVLRRRGTAFAYLGFNLADPVSGNPALRRAVARAVDRESIIHYVLGDAARPAAALLPPEHWAGVPGLHAPAFDPQAARAILAEAGLTGAARPHLVYKTSSDPVRLRLATIIEHQLRAVGIDVEIRSYDWGTFYGDIKAGRFQMYSLAWIGIKLPDIFRYTMHSGAVPPAGANRGRLADPAVDRLIEAAEEAPDLHGQAERYRRLQRLLLRILPYVPLWYEDQVFVSRTAVSGYDLAADGNYDALQRVRREAAPGNGP